MNKMVDEFKKFVEKMHDQWFNRGSGTLAAQGAVHLAETPDAFHFFKL